MSIAENKGGDIPIFVGDVIHGFIPQRFIPVYLNVRSFMIFLPCQTPLKMPPDSVEFEWSRRANVQTIGGNQIMFEVVCLKVTRPDLLPRVPGYQSFEERFGERTDVAMESA
jgi:hypothetical protein